MIFPNKSLTVDPTMHGEISAIRQCTDVFALRGPPPAEIWMSWRDFSLYTNGEPCAFYLVSSSSGLTVPRCPMCASAIRWAGFKEVIYGSSIRTIAESESSHRETRAEA